MTSPATSHLPSLFGGDLAKGLSREPENGPFVHRTGSKAEIKTACRLVPVEHRPFHASPAALDGGFRHVSEQPSSEPVVAPLRHDEEVLEVYTRAAKERREVLKEDREAD